MIYKTFNGDCIFERQALCAQWVAVIVLCTSAGAQLTNVCRTPYQCSQDGAKIVVKIQRFRVQAGGDMQRTKIMPHLCALQLSGCPQV